MVKRNDAAAELLRRRRARTGVLGFTEYTHPSWESGKHHQELGDFVDKVIAGEITRGIIDAPPRHSKTEIVSRRTPAYYLGKHPDHQIIISSYSDDLSQDISRDVRNILKDPYYHALIGDEESGFIGAELDPDTTAGGRWGTTAGGVVVAAGIGGGITGRGAHLLLIDDPFKDREDADSPRMRERVWNWFHGVATTRLMPGGRILIIMTRWHEDDLVGRLEESEPEKWKKLTLQAIIDEDTEKQRALWPERYPLEVLLDKKDSLAKAGRLREWNAQYQQRPTAEEGVYIKREWFKERYDNPPEILRVYMASDLAVTEKKKSRFADYTVHVCGGLGTDGRLYVLEAWRQRAGPKEWIEALIDMAKRRHPMKWSAEAGVIRRAVEGQISDACARDGTYFDMNWISPIADKMARGSTFRGWSSMGRIVWPKNAPWAEEGIEIVVGFPTVRFDDWFDAMSTLCMSLDGATPPVAPSKKVKGNDAYQRIKAIKNDQWLTR